MNKQITGQNVFAENILRKLLFKKFTKNIKLTQVTTTSSGTICITSCKNQKI